MPKRILHYTNIGKVECIKTNLFKIFVETHTIFHKKNRENRGHIRHYRFFPIVLRIPVKHGTRQGRSEKYILTPQKENNPLSASPIPAALRGIHTLSRSLTGCFAQQNIGEVARSDGGVNTYNQNFILSFQPLSSGTTVPLVSPLLSATQGRRLNSSCSLQKRQTIKKKVHLLLRRAP